MYFDVLTSDDEVTLLVPKRAQRILRARDYGLSIEQADYGITVSRGGKRILPRVEYLLSYHQGNNKSIFRTIGLRATAAEAPDAPSVSTKP